MSATMIPCLVQATLNADLTYNPSVHVQTVEIDRTGVTLISPASNNYVKWFLGQLDFVNMLRIVPGEADHNEQIFTMDASQGRLMNDASEAVLKFGPISQTYNIPLQNPQSPGFVGDTSVNYTQVLLQSDGTTTHNPTSSTTLWYFPDASINLTVNWSADDAEQVTVTADAGAHLNLMKPYNDAAADFIQVKLHNDPFDAHNRDAGSSDITFSTVDYASKFDIITGNLIDASLSVPTLTIDDLTLTRSLQQVFSSDGSNRRVFTTSSLRTVTQQAVESRILHGFQSTSGITPQFNTSIAGAPSNPANNPSVSLTPIITIKYNAPTRFALFETDLNGSGLLGNQLYNYLYVAGIDASGNIDNLHDDLLVTSKIQTYDGTDVSASSYEKILIKHSVFEDPNTQTYSDSSFNTYMYKLNFPNSFYVYNSGNARSNDLSAVTVNGITLNTGREKTNLTEIYPPSDISFGYMITQAITNSVTLTPIPAVSAFVAMATQTSTRGIMSFTGGYDLRITDQYPGASTGVHKVCLYHTSGTTETVVSGAIGTLTVAANEVNTYLIVNDAGGGKLTIWVSGLKQWNVSGTDVANKTDLGNIDKLGTTYLDAAENRVNGKLQDFKVFDSVISDSDAESYTFPIPTAGWSMTTTSPEYGTVALANGSALTSLSYIKSEPIPRFVPAISSQIDLPATKYTLNSGTVQKQYVFNRPLENYSVDGTFTSTDTTHTGSTSYSSSGNTATISFPVNNSSGYTVSGLTLRNTLTSETIDINDATYGFTLSSSQIWIAPTTSTASLTTQSSLTDSYLLVNNKEVTLRAAFTGGSDFWTTTGTSLLSSLEYSTNAGGSYSALTLSAIGLSVHASNKTIDFNFTATSTNEHLFRMKFRGEDGAILDTYHTFTVGTSNIYTFPTMSSVSKDIAVVTLGQTLTCTSNFSATLPSGVTGSASVTPTGYTALTASNVSVSGTTYVYSFAVNYDVTYSATITLTFGGVSQIYSWVNASTPFTITGNDIYTFPSSFSYSGTLKESEANPMTLTFSGGDMLHSSTVSLQIEYVKWNQGSDNTLDSSVLTCSDPAETITISSLTPSVASVDLIMKVKLKGPDGALSSEITLTITNTNIQEVLPSLVIPSTWTQEPYLYWQQELGYSYDNPTHTASWNVSKQVQVLNEWMATTNGDPITADTGLEEVLYGNHIAGSGYAINSTTGQFYGQTYTSGSGYSVNWPNGIDTANWNGTRGDTLYQYGSYNMIESVHVNHVTYTWNSTAGRLGKGAWAHHANTAMYVKAIDFFCSPRVSSNTYLRLNLYNIVTAHSMGSMMYVAFKKPVTCSSVWMPRVAIENTSGGASHFTEHFILYGNPSQFVTYQHQQWTTSIGAHYIRDSVNSAGEYQGGVSYPTDLTMTGWWYRDPWNISTFTLYFTNNMFMPRE